MNKKILLPLIMTISVVIIIISGIIYSNINSQEIPTQTDITVNTTEVDDELAANIADAQAKISMLKTRLSFKGLIQDGDLHFQNKEYTRALVKYLEVNKKTPSDRSIINKIGNIYYSLNRYDLAYKYYSQIKDYTQLDIHRAIKALFFSEDMSLDNLQHIKDEVSLYELTQAEKFYYDNSLLCVENFHLCRQGFQDYFNNPESVIASGNGELDVIEDIIFDDLEHIQTALTNYENFQYDDLSYKSALISGAYFENGLYSIAIATSEDVLKESPDYRPLIKIIATSYYEIGDYINAKKFLIQYNGLGDNEPEISYFLGIVHQKLREYTRSTIQLRKAITLGFTNTLDVKRRLLFNYYQLDDAEKMLNIFSEIIDGNQDEFSEVDLSLAIFYNILYDKIEVANTYTIIGLEKFPENEVFYAYNGWILLQSEELNETIFEEADALLQKGLAINNKSPMISLTLGQLEEKRNNKDKAFIYYKQTISLDQGGEYGDFAKTKLETLNLETK